VPHAEIDVKQFVLSSYR